MRALRGSWNGQTEYKPDQRLGLTQDTWEVRLHHIPLTS